MAANPPPPPPLILADRVPLRKYRPPAAHDGPLFYFSFRLSLSCRFQWFSVERGKCVAFEPAYAAAPFCERPLERVCAALVRVARGFS